MRKKRKISSRPAIAVVVDGECEIWYLQMIKRHERSISINIEPKLPQNKNLHDQYRMVCNLAEDYTKVFWIVDFDAILLETKDAKKGTKTPLQTFIEYHNSKKENVVIIVNNPCLEFWFLLHFEFTSRYYSCCDEIEKYFKKKKYIPDYCKNREYYTKQDNDIYIRLKPYLLTAIKNAEKTGGFNSTEHHKGIAEMQLFFKDKEFNNLFAC